MTLKSNDQIFNDVFIKREQLAKDSKQDEADKIIEAHESNQLSTSEAYRKLKALGFSDDEIEDMF